MHGGASPRAKAAAARKRQENAAIEAVATYGLPREIGPHEALIEELWRTSGHVTWLALKIKALEDEQLHGPVGGSQFGIPREEAHIWVRLYQEERTHFTKVATACVAAGIEERRVRIAEEQGRVIASFARELAREFGVDPNSERARTAFRKHLRLVQDDDDDVAV